MANICGARTGTGEMCTRTAGFGTDHFGSGKCFIHDSRDGGKGYAKVLQIIARDPDLASRAQAYLDSDEELLNARRELAVLKARFEVMNVDREEDSDIPNLVKLAKTISLMTKRIQDIEIGRRHYLHIDVISHFIADFSRIGQKFLPDPDVRERFLDELESEISGGLQKASARRIAAGILAKGAAQGTQDIIEGEMREVEIEEEDEEEEDT